MSDKLKYFVFNKPEDYERGFLDNMECRSDGIAVRHNGGGSRGRFLSRVLDSGEVDLEWHRLGLRIGDGSTSSYKITVYASNTVHMEYQGQKVHIPELIQSPTIPFDEKLHRLEPYRCRQVMGMRDILLHGIKGQYLWVGLELYDQGETPLVISDLIVYLPAQSWLAYLPAVYQRADAATGFLERFLAIFQTLYEDLTGDIERVSDYFDTECKDKEFLLWLSDWLDIADSYVWSQQQLQELLRHAVELYRRRGTRQSIQQIVELYTGETPYIVETFALDKFRDTPDYEQTLLPMFGNDPYSFTVLVKEEYIRTRRQYNILLKIIEEMKPVHTELKLIPLKPFIFLSAFSYLGVNSVLGEYTDFSLDGSGLLPLSKIAK